MYIIVLDDFTGYVYDDTVYEAAKTLYREYSLGYGEEKGGELPLLPVEARGMSGAAAFRTIWKRATPCFSPLGRVILSTWTATP